MTLATGFLVCVLISVTCAAELEVVHQWNLIEYSLPIDYNVRDFRPENTLFTGLEVTKDRLFLAMPRLRAGNPATLAYVARGSPPGSSPALRAYPDWSFHEAGRNGAVGNVSDCSGLVSVYRIRTDSCNRLWVLDSGITTSLDNFRRVCPPKFLIFDLTTDQVVRQVIFPQEVLRPASLLTNFVIDETVQGTCDSAFVYMTDTAAPGMVVYDARKDTAWRVTHPSMFPDPDHGTYTVGGESFTLMDGVVGLTHSPNLATLFFQPLATDRIFSIPTAALTKGPLAELEELPVALVGRKSSEGLGLALNPKDDTLYFSPLSETSIASWNPVSNQQSLVAYDPTLLQFPAELRWKDDSGLWILGTRFQKYFRRTVSPNEINLRIMRVRPSRPAYPTVNNHLYYKK